MSGKVPACVNIDALLFDKDGTLFDFQVMWGSWAHGVMELLTGGDPAGMQALASEMKYDLAARAFLPDSTMVTETNRECAATMQRALPHMSLDALEEVMNAHAAHAPLEPVLPLAPYLDGLRQRGLKLGVMTNDAEVSAHAHLGAAGVRDRFDFIAGSDSGFGGKPQPEPLLAFARAVGLKPARVAMVGDSTHDLLAGRAAGMVTVGVLTGLADTATLAPFADVVLADIGDIPAWLDA